MTNVYQIEVLRQSSVDGKPPTWKTAKTHLTVLANGDIRVAMKKAERHILREKPYWWCEDGQKHVERVTGVKVVGATLDSEVDVL